ncbi:MAG: UDP-N-acetylmuramoyl-L-alanine--D-glutamate ligase, partial [Gammaproteobacteria bacterium]|nr:UDP-N-acetylmuramoyl-L-alanine--D-glutamate ligase [Gammaproteobacteria bacterium]
MNGLDALINELREQRLLVVGLGKTGHSVCEFLSGHQIAFDAADDRELSELGQKVTRMPQFGQLHTEFSADGFKDYDLLIVSPGVPLSLPAIQAAATAGASVIGDVELFTRAAEAPVIAVTGSNGKSTVVAWVDAVLSKTPMHAVLCGNIGEPVLSSLDADADLYVLELSSFQLESTRSLHTLSATVLNVSEDHMDRYDSLEHYAATKRKIYHGCETCVINLDDSRTWVGDEDGAVAEIIGFGTKPPEAGQFGLSQHEGSDWLAAGNKPLMPVAELPLPGRHNALNA